MKGSKLESFKLNSGAALSTADLRRISGGDGILLTAGSAIPMAPLAVVGAVAGTAVVSFGVGYAIGTWLFS